MENKELDTLLSQEKELILTQFTDSDAWALGSWMVKSAGDRKLPTTIDITRHGHKLFHFSFDGASPDNEQWIKRKAALVDRVGHVAVSGLPQEQDHALVAEALRAHIARGE